MNRVGEQYTLRVSRYDLFYFQQAYAAEGYRIPVSLDGQLYVLAGGLIAEDAGDGNIALTGTLRSAEEDDYSRGYLETSGFGILSKS